ncbi:glycosyltransferase involved in cell wall biosynthesis [Paraburkholderia bannensis]|uniref:Glycosyltransferase involved in cell wall biosynthesis n=1 Tax=Paraburkholderia bannensis TaxID=765414 RepID=A0A7W9TSV3_9BURK|nr:MULTISPECIES: glycosyltransferase [Paraburkholderia]MBB3255241.1 glycosyltransferase involved in cell wall biosynthesis [Paraburkholderia sp. WP4_3_2]MBB6100747.1 glycosyltransferase involved in cell wall biosynthesis [Paraburkholderia bannensis]
MIVFVAAYSPPDRVQHASLGAARKIEFFLELLTRISRDVLLVNTAHNETGWQGRSVREWTLAGSRIRELSLRTYPLRPVGKLLNLLEVNSVAQEIGEHGVLSLVWVYNPYAFESLLARSLARRYGKAVVLEFEDWVLARRGVHPKSMLDWAAWRYVLPKPELCLAVNRTLQEREVERSQCRTLLCPGVVSTKLTWACAKRHPFTDAASGKFIVGYFGSLNAEKGADKVLALAELADSAFEIHVCGSGTLSGAFEAAAQRLNALIFHGVVPEEQLFARIAACDILLNLHSPIDKMGGGVFPFKVIEYVASGRLVLSTVLPDIGLGEITDALHVVGRDTSSILEALKRAAEVYRDSRLAIDRAKQCAEAMFGETGMEQAVRRLLAA